MSISICKTYQNIKQTLNDRLELVNVGRLSFKSRTSTFNCLTDCLGGCPPSVAATVNRYIDLSS